MPTHSHADAEPSPPHSPARSDHAARAAAIGDAARDALQLLERLNLAKPVDDDALASEAVAMLRRLTDAVVAVTDELGDARTVQPLSEDQIAFAIQGGVPPHVFADQGRRDAEDWIVWSAVRSDAECRRLDRLADLPFDEVVPGLRAAIDAFPEDFDDLDRHVVLCAPREELDGSSPIQWLLRGGDPSTVLELIDDLHRTS